MKDKDKFLYIEMAKLIANQSYAKKLKVGAVFVSEDGLISIGYNGTPAGMDNTCEDLVYVDEVLTGEEMWDEKNQQYYKYVTKPEVLHAEQNVFAKIKKAGLSTKNGLLFLTHSPCFRCALDIYQSGIKSVYYVDEYRSLDGVNFLKERGIYVEKVFNY